MTTYATTREIPAPVDSVFAAFTDPCRLARWWGPAGFTNTFETCEFRTGGRWRYVMHGPDGHDFRNESEFETVEPPGKVVIRHISEPKYRLTILLEPTAAGTRVHWSQAFDNERVGSRLERIVVPGNEQNLDRLSAEVARPA